MIRNLFIFVLLGAVAWTSYLAYKARQPSEESRHSLHSTPLVDETRNATELLGQLMHIATTAAAQQPRAAGYSRVAPQAIYRGAIHYSPFENLEAIDVATIEQSRCDHLDVAAFSLTDYVLAKAIVDFANRGRRVRIYRDKEQYAQEEARDNYAGTLFAGSKNISIRVKGSRTYMHLKAYSDGCVLREGSANFSPSGEKQQDNTLTLTSDQNAVRAFEADFDSMWNRPDNRIIQ